LETLVRRAATGPPEARRQAFGELVRRYQDTAYGYAYALLGDREAAQDAAQEAFLAAYRSLGQLRAAEAFPGWLRRIVRTYCLRAAASTVDGLPLEAADGVPSGDDPACAAEAAELRAALADLIRRLPASEREAMVLFYVADRPQDEIAAFLGVPVNTVKKRLQAARARLRGRMDEMVRQSLRAHAPSRGRAFADAVQFLAGLDAAAAEGELRLVELMAIDGVELDAPDRDGRTLLGWAAERGHAEAAALLIESGARVNARDGEGRTALARAIDAGHHEIAELLRTRGGRL
jgi:RNA polymerase sigma factor (sigma-70 family)